MTTKRRRGSNRIPGAAFTAVILASGTLTGCGAQEETVVYCVDENDEVVDENLCDQDSGSTSGGGFFFFMAGNYGSGLQPGTKLDRSAGSRFSPTDTAARKSAGLPETGKVSTGKSGTYFRQGGFGSGFKGGAPS